MARRVVYVDSRINRLRITESEALGGGAVDRRAPRTQANGSLGIPVHSSRTLTIFIVHNVCELVKRRTVKTAKIAFVANGRPTIS